MLDPEELQLSIVLSENYDEETNKIIVETQEIRLKHSLASLSKWEAIWETPLLDGKEKTTEQQLSYLECMCLTPDVSPEVFRNLSEKQRDQVAEHLDKKYSATWFGAEKPQSKSGEVTTAELVYYWMTAFQIPWEAQHWHLNRLLTLVKVHSVKQDNKPKKISARDAKNQREQFLAENNRRRAELGSKG